LAKGDLTEATAWAEKPAFVARQATSLSTRGRVYGLAGRRDDAIEMMNELKELAQERYVSPYHFWFVHYAIGDVDAARKAAQEMYEERANYLVFSKVSPSLDPIRSDPRFKSILRQMRLAE